MKHLIFLALVCFIFLSTSAQKTADPVFKKRLNEYIALTKQLNFEKLMDYVHPKLFKIVPRDQMLQMFQSAFENEMMSISIDSLSILQTSPAYSYQGSLYRK